LKASGKEKEEAQAGMQNECNRGKVVRRIKEQLYNARRGILQRLPCKTLNI
jgi:hypothetical protein